MSDIGSREDWKTTPGAYVLHPRIVFGIDESGLVLSSSDGEALSTGDAPEVLAVVAAFMAPRALADVAAELSGSGVDIDEIIEVFLASAIIIPSEDAASIGGDVASTTQNLSLIIGLAHRIAGDLAGFGVGRDAPSHRAHIDVLQASVGLLQLTYSLASKRRPHLDAQLERLRGSAEQGEVKLHLGAGGSRIPGWINVDIAPAELSMDLRWGLPFDDATASHVFLSHFLEHLTRVEAVALLADIHRVLAPGGIVRIIVPNFRRYAEAYVSGDVEFFEVQRRHWEWASHRRTNLERVIEYAAGADAAPSAFMLPHRYGYDFETLSMMLVDAGFGHVEESAYMASSDASLRVDDNAAYAGVSLDGRAFSLFVEARK